MLVAAIMCCTFSIAQNNFTALIKHAETKEPIANAYAEIRSLNVKTTADSLGRVIFNNLPNGKYKLQIQHAGFEETVHEFELPLLLNGTTDIIYLEEHEEELDDVIVQTTRTSRTIKNTPTRIEVINDEELAEKNNMRPANVVMLLHESTGMRIQQTSPTSANASIRMQGLDGRYTQLLKDGYPNFGGFASGLSILEIPPIDLRQVEIIKGPAGTLYGGGSIAGVINFISKTPDEKGEYNFLLNQSNIGQSNIGLYASQKKGKFGYAITGLVNFQKAYDVDDDDFSELPEANDFTINPRLFYYPTKNTTITLGNSFTKGKRTGGDIQVIKNKADAIHSYFEKNETLRNTTTASLETKLDEKSKIVVKQSLSIFNRELTMPAYNFEGANTNSFTEASYSTTIKKHTVIGGLNFVYDKFKQKNTAALNNLNAATTTAGIYIQDTWDVGEKIVIESGLRVDHSIYKNDVYKYDGTFVLPRISTLFRISNKLQSRISAGLGYKTPTAFTEETETLQYRNIAALHNVKAERSMGTTADINFKTNLASNLQFSLNHMFFYTRISKPLVLVFNGFGYNFVNASEPIHTKGFETNARFIFKDDFKFFAGYTYTHATAKYLAPQKHLRLTPQHQVNLVLMYEKHENFKFGLEGYYTGSQYLSDLTKTPDFWELGFMAEKTFNKFSFFINFENFTDTKQTSYKNVVNGPHTNPQFDEIWTHVEGFVFNGGVKIKL